MSQQYLKLSKNSQSAAVSSGGNVVAQDGGRDPTHQVYATTDQGRGATSQQLSKGKSEVQTFQKKLNRRDLNLIPPSAAIVQSLQGGEAYSSHHEGNTYGAAGNRNGYQLTLNSTQNKNKASPWENFNSQ